MTKRKNELSFMNIIMSLLVIFIHIASWTLPSMSRESTKYVALLVPWRLSAFVVQGFLFLSGVKLFSSKKPFSYPKFMWGRVVNVYIPYLLWIAVYYAYFIYIGWYKFSLSDTVEYITLGTLCSHFYYVVIAMQFYLLMPLFLWLVKRVNGLLLSVLAVALTAFVKAFVHFQYDDRVFFAYLCYFVCGAVVGRNYEKVTAVVKRYAAVIIGAFMLFGTADAYLTYRQMVLGAYYRYFEVLHLAYAIAAIFSLFALSLLIFEKREFPRFLALVDRSTYGIYLSHILFIYIANDYLYRLGISDMFLQFAIRGVFTYVASFALCLGYTFVKEKTYAGVKERNQ